ncbi:PEP-CTERM sorting domain-containing protein [Nitrosomonas marina]|uniref:PEP-CTERM motif-containing protein n=1 Tax=Nitrosomonas marina TaxID=917 RepID=A0A1H8HNQ3_9PROT|nr:PEP-CTERM sorting domain-containing protein [Nitrosomonas marina]SEN57749.1 PEP-CTERM motif-containing protein [Nitrosomonas marina]
MRNLMQSLSHAVKAALITMVTLFSANIDAAGAVTSSSWTSTNHLNNSSTSISAEGAGLNPQGYTDNALLNYSAWGHAGDWFTFQNHLDGIDVSVAVNGDAAFVPGFTVWATGTSEFDGGTTNFAAEVSSAGWGTPHSFNATGKIGDNGTRWMADGQGGNVLETLGYAVANPGINHTLGTGWGETIQFGTHDVSLTNTFETGITGSTGIHSATLEFNDLAAGWYAIYVGGTDGSFAGGGYDLVVSAVPEAHTWAMLLAGMGLIGWRMRHRPRNGSTLIPVY